MSAIQMTDLLILNWIQENMRHPLLDKIMPLISHLGDSGICWILVTLILLTVRQHRKIGLSLSAGLILDALFCNLLLKPIIKRLRPCDLYQTTVLLIPCPKDYSFPSGHTMASFVSAFILYQYNKTWGRLAYILATLIGLSRLYLYVHFPSDVLSGAILGIGIGYFVKLFIIPQIANWKRKNKLFG